MAMVPTVPVSPARLSRMVDWFVLAAAAVLCGVGAAAGLQGQRALWENTEPIRFRFDITNAYSQGQLADGHGLVHTYDYVARNAYRRPDGVLDYGLDYPPLRLTAACLWYRWTRTHFPNQSVWQNTWEFNAPLLMMNRVYLMIAAISVGLLAHMARRWKSQASSPDGPWLSTGVIPAIIAAGAVWFSPVANLVGFAWPQWDICVPAFFLATVYAGCRNCWLLAGMLLAVGAMFKGQVLVGLPVMLIWPAVCGNWTGILRLAVGFLLGVGLITAPFMFHSTEAPITSVEWLAGVMLLPCIVGAALRNIQPRRAWWAVWLIAVIVACGIGGMLAGGWRGGVAAVLLSLATSSLTARLPWRYTPSAVALAVAGAIWTCAAFTPCSWEWLKVGILYGTEHFQQMTMGNPSNLPAILHSEFGVNSPEMVAFVLPTRSSLLHTGEWAVTWGTLLRCLLAMCMMLCGIAMGIHYRRRNPLFLFALTALWLAFVTFPAQIHERYVLYPAIVSATLLALGTGATFMHIAIALISILPVLSSMLATGNPHRWMVERMGEGFGQQLRTAIEATHPGVGWALITLTLVSLFIAAPLRTSARNPKLPRETLGPKIKRGTGR